MVEWMQPHPFFGDVVSQVVGLILEEFTLGWLELQVCFLKCSTLCTGNISVTLQSLKRQSCHPSRSNSRSGSTHPDSSASVFGMWLGHNTAQCHALAFKESYIPTVKAVNCFEASPIASCQNPAFKSKQEKYPVPTRLLIASCTHGSR